MSRTICGLDIRQTVNIIERWFNVAHEREDGSFESIPFRLRNYQRRALEEIFAHPDDNVLIEKTRQIGMSWLFAAVFAAIVLVGDRSNLLVIGKKEEFVDQAEENVKTLMGRVKFILRTIRDETVRKYARKVVKSSYLFIKNRATGTVVTGESSAKQSGRGETNSVVWWDEAAFTPNDGAILASVSPNCARLWMLSTANGKSNVFYRTREKIEDGKITGWHKIRLHWSEYFDGAWYERQKSKLGGDPTLVAQELDIDYEGSGNDRIFYNFPDANFRPDVKFDPALRESTVVAWDFGIRDFTAGAVIQYHEGLNEFRVVDSMLVYNVPFEDVLRLLTERDSGLLEALRHKTRPEMWETLYRFYAGTVSWRYADIRMTGDPAANARSLTDGTSISDLFFDYGIDFETYSDRTEPVLSAIRGRADRIFVRDDLVEVKECLKKWSYEIDRNGQPVKPRHDEFSHMGSALKYGFNWFFKNLLGGMRTEEV